MRAPPPPWRVVIPLGLLLAAGAARAADGGLAAARQQLEEGLQQLPRESLEIGLLPYLAPALQEAMRTLADGGDAGLQALAGFLGHRLPAARLWAARILGETGGAAAGPALRGALADLEPAVRLEAARALGYCGDSGALPRLDRAVQTEGHPAVRAGLRSARALLLQIEEVRRRPTVEGRLSGWLDLLRYRFAVDQLVAHGAAAVPLLIERLAAAEPAQAAGAALALARLGDARGIDPLLRRALNTRRSSLARALALYENEAVGDALARLLESDDFSLEHWALRGLERWRRPDTQALLLAYLQRRMTRNWHRKPMVGDDIPVNTLAQACDLLAEVGDAACLPVLRRLITEAPAGENLVHGAAIEAYQRVNARVREEGRGAGTHGEADHGDDSPDVPGYRNGGP